MTNFHEDCTEIVNFLPMANFVMCLIFLPQTLLALFKVKYWNKWYIIGKLEHQSFLLKQQKRARHHQGICQPLELKKFDLYSVIQARVMPLSISLHLSIKGSFKNHLDIYYWFFDHLPTSVKSNNRMFFPTTHLWKNCDLI